MTSLTPVKGSDKATGKGAPVAATAQAAEPITCPEGTVPVEVHGNADKSGKETGKAAKPLKKVTETTRYPYDGLSNVVANEYGQNGQDVAQYYRSQRDIVARKRFGLKGLVNPGQETTLPMAGGLKSFKSPQAATAMADPGRLLPQGAAHRKRLGLPGKPLRHPDRADQVATPPTTRAGAAPTARRSVLRSKGKSFYEQMPWEEKEAILQKLEKLYRDKVPRGSGRFSIPTWLVTHGGLRTMKESVGILLDGDLGALLAEWEKRYPVGDLAQGVVLLPSVLPALLRRPPLS